MSDYMEGVRVEPLNIKRKDILSSVQIKALIETWNIKVYVDHKFSIDLPLEKMLPMYNYFTGENIQVDEYISRLVEIKERGFI